MTYFGWGGGTWESGGVIWWEDYSLCEIRGYVTGWWWWGGWRTGWSMRVWNSCCGNKRRKLMKTSKSIAELSDSGSRPRLTSHQLSAPSRAVTHTARGAPLLFALDSTPATPRSFCLWPNLPGLFCPAQVRYFSICLAGSAVSAPSSPVFHSNRTPLKNHIIGKYILSSFLNCHFLWGRNHGFF